MMFEAIAAPPPLPNWVEDDDGGDDPDTSAVIDGTVEGEGIGARSGEVTCGIRPHALLHDWVDPAAGIVGVVFSGEPDTEVWLLSTARRGEQVVHWTQGPYEGLRESGEIALQLPADALSAEVAFDVWGTVSTRVITQTVDGTVLSGSPLSRLIYAVDEDGVVVIDALAAWTWAEVADSPSGDVSADLTGVSP